MHRRIPFQAEQYFWQVDASFLENGDLLIISGDADNEWHCTVAAAHLPLLDAALTKDVPLSATDDGETHILEALAHRFAGERNPYEDILRFLEQHGISMVTTAWLSGD